MIIKPSRTTTVVDAHRRRWVTGRELRVLISASGASFMIMLDSNIVAVSLPSISRDLHAVFSDIEWVISAYVLAFAAFLMPAGALTDRFGRRRLLAAGLGLFTLASLSCGLAPTASALNAARTLQGVGAATQLSAALAVLGNEFQGPQRARAFGFWGTVIGVAVAIGPFVGGVITSALGWRWAFFVNLPFGFVLFSLVIRNVRESKDPHARKLDLAGMVVFGVCLLCFVSALIDTNTSGRSSKLIIAKFLVSALLVVLYVFVEISQDRPMVDLRLFRNSTFVGSCFAMLGFAAAAQVMMTYLPLYLQNVFGLSPVLAGVGMLPFALPLFFCPRIATKLSTKMSGRTLLTLGLAIVAAGDFLTAVSVTYHQQYVITAIGMLIIGCGAGLLNGETAKVSMSVVPPERGGMASGISGTLRFVGLVMGITGLGTVLSTRTTAHLERALLQQLPGVATDVHSLTSHIVGGDPSGATSHLSPVVSTAVLQLGRVSFAHGFSAVLIVAGATATVTAALAYSLISEAATAPSGGH